MYRICFLFLCILYKSAFGQSFSDSANALSSYPPDGVYFSFTSFKNGKPGLTRNQLLSSIYDSSASIGHWTEMENLYFRNSNGVKMTVGRDSIWGYAENGTVYIGLGLRFHKIRTLGSISYFLESYPRMNAGMAPVVTDSRSNSYYRLLDMEDGTLYDYTPQDMETILQSDQELQNEFQQLPSEKLKRKKLYQYIEKFNRKHPLFFNQNPGS